MDRIIRAVGALTVVATASVGCSSTGGEGGAEPVTVFAAASLEGAFDELIDEIAQAIDVEVVYDGSSTLVLQIHEGAHADVLATANESTMGDAVDSELTHSEPVLFASNGLVMAVAEGNPLGISSLRDAIEHDYAVCAVQVPCGDATTQLFDQAGLLLDPISEEQSVTAVANRVAEGDVDVGFIYTTDVASRPELTSVFPEEANIVNTYPIATVSDDPRAQEFVDFLLSDDGARILQKHGFGQP